MISIKILDLNNGNCAKTRPKNCLFNFQIYSLKWSYKFVQCDSYSLALTLSQLQMFSWYYIFGYKTVMFGNHVLCLLIEQHWDLMINLKSSNNPVTPSLGVMLNRLLSRSLHPPGAINQFNSLLGLWRHTTLSSPISVVSHGRVYTVPQPCRLPISVVSCW